ncbi:MAG: hypothetical protein FWC43_12260 [Planctomycetaceae bacterium]|nr:hypothetical protein [Planctomycetaceae bacterium]
MKKTTLLVCLILFVSAFSLGCTISSPSEWCRRGSLWPFKQSSQETIMMAPTSYSPMPGCCDPCANIDPCANMGGQNIVLPDASNY